MWPEASERCRNRPDPRHDEAVDLARSMQRISGVAHERPGSAVRFDFVRSDGPCDVFSRGLLTVVDIYTTRRFQGTSVFERITSPLLSLLHTTIREPELPPSRGHQT